MDSTLYFGGNIITMEDKMPVEAILVEGSVIRGVGDFKSVSSLCKSDTKKVDLKGKTLMPSFIDSHSHITAVAASMGLIPLQTAKSFEDIIKRLGDAKQAGRIAPGKWLIGFSYDHNGLLEKSHPTRQTLDRVFQENPVVIVHTSGHMGVFNSLALQQAGICAETPNPSGGVIGREKDGKTPNGYLEETAFLSAQKHIPAATLADSLQQLELAQKVYLENGITTVQDGFVKGNEWETLRIAAQEKSFWWMW